VFSITITKNTKQQSPVANRLYRTMFAMFFCHKRHQYTICPVLGFSSEAAVFIV